jgi:hypothetical protein
MNLVQISERLKDMPPRAVEMYVNGSSQQVPAYLALAEMQRREKVAKQASLEQGAAQGQMPSIKEQIEQRAGLMALQQGRMQQGQQQMSDQSSSRPMPVPPNIEPAEEQPQAEDSGIARIPVKEDMYRFARGGIIGFNGEDQSEKQYLDFVYPSPEEMAGLTPEQRFNVMNSYNQILRANLYRKDKQREAQEREQQNKAREERLRFLDTASPTAAANVRREESSRSFNPEAQATPEPTVAQLQRILNPQSSRGAAANVRPSGNVRSATVQPSPEAAKPTAEAAPTNTSKLPDIFTDPTYMNVVKESLKQKTPQELFQEQQDMLRMQGITGPLGAEQERRAKERQAAYESSRPTGLQDLARVLGQAGQFKGMSGIAPAYTSLQQQRRAEDLKFREQQDKLLDEIEEKRRAEATGRAGAIREDIFKGRDIASRTAGAVSASQIQARAKFVEQGMSEAAAERLAAIKFDYDKRLRATPQAQRATLEEQYVADLVKNGLPRHLAIAEAKKLGSSDKGVESRTLNNMATAANKTLEPVSGATDAEKAAARALLDQIKKRQMELSGLGGGASTGKVMSMADVQATAAKNNKTIAEVIEAAKKAGYTIK